MWFSSNSFSLKNRILPNVVIETLNFDGTEIIEGRYLYVKGWGGGRRTARVGLERALPSLSGDARTH